MKKDEILSRLSKVIDSYGGAYQNHYYSEGEREKESKKTRQAIEVIEKYFEKFYKD